MVKSILAILRHTVIALVATLVLGSDLYFVSQTDDDPSVDPGQFGNATALAVDPGGNPYVLDVAKNELVKMDSSAIMVQSTGGYGWSTTAFDQPSDLAAPNGLDVFVADYGNHRIQHFDRNLNYVSTLYLREDDDPNRRFGYPMSVALSRLGDLFLVDGENRRVVKIVNNNSFDRAFGGQGSGTGQLQDPSRVRISAADLVYVQDGNTLKVFDLFGNYVRTVGEGMFSNLKTFALTPNGLCVLDSCTLKMVGERGALDYEVTLPASDGENGDCSIRDFAVRGNTLYILTKQHLMLKTLSDIDRDGGGILPR